MWIGGGEEEEELFIITHRRRQSTSIHQSISSAVVRNDIVGSNHHWIFDVTIVMDDTASMQTVLCEGDR